MSHGLLSSIQTGDAVELSGSCQVDIAFGVDGGASGGGRIHPGFHPPGYLRGDAFGSSSHFVAIRDMGPEHGWK